MIEDSQQYETGSPIWVTRRKKFFRFEGQSVFAVYTHGPGSGIVHDPFNMKTWMRRVVFEQGQRFCYFRPRDLVGSEFLKVF